MNVSLKSDTDISDAEESNQECSKGRGEGEDLSVPLEELKVVRQACDHRLHAAHLVDTKREGHKKLKSCTIESVLKWKPFLDFDLRISVNLSPS